MALRNAETIVRLTGKIQGGLTNLKLMVKTQQPVEEFVRYSELEREHAALRNG